MQSTVRLHSSSPICMRAASRPSAAPTTPSCPVHGLHGISFAPVARKERLLMLVGSQVMVRLPPVLACEAQLPALEDVGLKPGMGLTPAIPQDPLHTRVLKTAVKTTAMVALGLLLVFGRVMPAAAARSGGRVGGFASSGGMSRSFSSSSRGGGYSSGGFGGFGSSSGGSSGGFRGYSGGGSSSYSGGLAKSWAPSHSRSTVIWAPSFAGSASTSAPSKSENASTASEVEAFAEVMATVTVMLVVMGFISFAGSTGSATSYGAASSMSQAYAPAPLSLTKVQVGALALARELKAELDVIADASDTSTSGGLHKLLQATVLALQRNPAYAVYGAASQQSVANGRDLERSFNTASMEVREKFEQETLVNVRGRRSRSSYSPSAEPATAPPDELVVVTLLVATRAKVAGMPGGPITTAAQLQQALAALGRVPAESVMGVEVMWTPQAAGDYYTRDELTTDFPELMPL